MADAAPRAAIARPWRGRIALIGLFAVFFGPVVVALTLNVLAPGWVPFGRINRGELVEPPRVVALGDIEPLDGDPGPAASTEAVWMLAHVGPPTCPPRCAEILLHMRQARLALGKDAHRVSRWWLVTSRPNAGTVSVVRSAYPGLRIGLIDPGSTLSEAHAEPVAVQLVDPAGLLILRYRGDSLAADMHKDLKRLLKISKQG